jgi:hypothetical protein
MATFFETLKKNFTDVPIDGDKISTSEFLEATESLVTLFGTPSSFCLAVPAFLQARLSKMRSD